MILYHGSPNTNITQLEIAKEYGSGDQYGRGIYLTTDYDEAEGYAKGGRVYKVSLDNSLKLYNMEDKLPQGIIDFLYNELKDSDDDFKNSILRYNRKIYSNDNVKELEKFYNEKEEEWKQKDGYYSGNKPELGRDDNDKLIITYTDYDSIEETLKKLTGQMTLKAFSGNIDPSTFASWIISEGYDGIITHNNQWYIIYKNADKVKIVENKKLDEDLDDATNILLTLIKEKVPEYADKISNVQIVKTKKGDEALSFYFEGDNYMVLWYPKKDHSYACFKNGRGLGYANNIFDILEHKLSESRKLTEAGRNELLALAKGETITRYNKAAGYKGFSLVDIDTNSIMVHDSIVVTNRVGNYYDTIELEDILYWVGLYVEESKDKKMGIKIAEKALLGAADGMDIKIDCNCGDFVYRFAYQATILGYKYGKPENRPANITNPNNYGSMCKHLIAMLSNKQWLRQVASTLNDWIIENIEWVRKYLNVSEEDFQLPDEVARELGRHGAYAKFIDKNFPEDEEENNEDETQEDELEEIDDTESTESTEDEEQQDSSDAELEEK